ncbi:MAG: heparinase II/III family protein [Calditrichaeota bacterium]|nr:heparinase II/III family protein [Calditrichota bacterium]
MIQRRKYLYFLKIAALIISFCVSTATADSPIETVPANRLLSDAELLSLLRADAPELQTILELRDTGNTDSAIAKLLEHLRNASTKRYFFDWRNVAARFADYQRRYPGNRNGHAKLAEYQTTHFAPETHWQLPFVDLTGDSVSAYELRHLARQQKSADMAVMFYYEQQNPVYPDYFVRQIADLNRAFAAGKYDDAGNGIYERFRAGKRVQNWLFCHHMYLGSEIYGDTQQLQFLKTMLHHAAQLAQRTENFSYGNHHTRGLVALFEIAAVFPDFRDAAQWQQQAIAGLLAHLKKEINDDGFQFERSVHYHNGDIENYFRVYQLAKLNGIQLPDEYVTRFRKMFDALVNIAQPNRRTPVLQDDTDRPYAENNPIDGVMAIGTLLFDDPVYKYFAGDALPDAIFWLLREQQLARFDAMNSASPTVGSVDLPETGYFVMRNGWHETGAQMTISAGISAKKPDHQHGEALSITAFANGHEILPNYQVNYNIPGYRYWKNSWVKNVALADSIPLGRGWRQNSGKSGFGKWRILPKSTVTAWQTTADVDYFAGTHDGFDSLGVAYSREILFVKDGFWIVRDRFSGNAPHDFQQIWQGKYTVQKDGDWLRSTFPDGSGLDIVQLNPANYRIDFGGRDGKQHAVFSIKETTEIAFTTLLFPFASYRESVSMAESPGKIVANDWEIQKNPGKNLQKVDTFESDAAIVLQKSGDTIIFLTVQRFKTADKTMAFESPVDLILRRTPQQQWDLRIISRMENQVQISGNSQSTELQKTHEIVQLKSNEIKQLVF